MNQFRSNASEVTRTGNLVTSLLALAGYLGCAWLLLVAVGFASMVDPALRKNPSAYYLEVAKVLFAQDIVSTLILIAVIAGVVATAIGFGVYTSRAVYPATDAYTAKKRLVVQWIAAAILIVSVFVFLVWAIFPQP